MNVTEQAFAAESFLGYVGGYTAYQITRHLCKDKAVFVTDRHIIQGIHSKVTGYKVAFCSGGTLPYANWLNDRPKYTHMGHIRTLAWLFCNQFYLISSYFISGSPVLMYTVPIYSAVEIIWRHGISSLLPISECHQCCTKSRSPNHEHIVTLQMRSDGFGSDDRERKISFIADSAKV